MTVTRERVRIKAIARDGRASCVFTDKGKLMGGDRMAATVRMAPGNAHIEQDDPP